MPTFRVRFTDPSVPDKLIACDEVVVAPVQVLCHQFVLRDRDGSAFGFVALLPREGVAAVEQLGGGQPELPLLGPAQGRDAGAA